MRATGPLLKVLHCLLGDPTSDHYGLELVRATKLKSGTLYPILDRLEAEGWVTSRWEEAEPTALRRPRRRFYRMTGLGAHEGRQMLFDHGVGLGTWVSSNSS